jgi:hypothetical protein
VPAHQWHGLAPLVVREPTTAAAREKITAGIHQALAELAATVVTGPDGEPVGRGEPVGGPEKATQPRGRRRAGTGPRVSFG